MTRRLAILSIIVIGAVVVAAVLNSCGTRPQPMGEEIWRAL